MDQYSNILVVGFLAFATMAMVWVVLRMYRKVGPATAMIISGRSKLPRIIVGGGGFAFPVIHTVNFLNLGNRTITVTVKGVYTSTAVPVNVTAVAQVKVSEDEAKLRAAASRFSTQSEEEIDKTLGETLAGHVRAIISVMSPEAVYNDRNKFSTEVVNLSGTELGTLGFDIDSCVIAEVGDENGYYEALGKKPIADAKRDADIATAEADRETRERQAAARLAAEQAEIDAATRIAEATKDRDLKIAEFKVASDTAQADAEIAGPLQTASRQKELAVQEGLVEVERQRQASSAAEVAIEVAQRRQQADVVVPAKAQREAVIETAEGDSQAVKARASGEAERLRLTLTAQADGDRAVGTAKADVEKAQLLAQAEGERQLAEARASQDEVNFRRDIFQIAADAKTEIGKAIANGMSNLGRDMKVVQFSNGNGDGGNALLNTLKGIPGYIAQADAAGDALFGFSFMDIFTGKFGKNGHANGNGANGTTPPEETPAVTEAEPEHVEEAEATSSR